MNEMKDSEERFRALFEKSPLPSFLWQRVGDDFVQLQHNNAAIELSKGYAEQTIGKSARELLAHRSEALQCLNRCYAEQRPITHIEHASMPRGSEPRWIERTCAFISPDLVMVYAQDVTDRKAAEVALRDSEDRYRSLVDLSPDAVYVQIQGKIVFVNFSTVRMFGADSEAQVVGMNSKELYRPDFWHFLDRRRDVVLKTGRAQPFAEFKYLRFDGLTFDGESAGTPILWNGEQAFLVVVRNITERKKAERKRAELKQQLRQAQKMDSLGTLAGGIAHELNNMLFPIVGLVELTMLEVPEGSRAHKNLDAVLQSALRATKLVDKILTFSHLDAAERKLVDLHGIIEEAMEFFGSMLPVTIHVRMELDEKPVTVVADEAQIHQVLMNLASNALHAMGGKVGELTIRLSSVNFQNPHDRNQLGLGAGTYAKLSFQDTGHGMDKETVDRIFEPFFTTKEVGEGTGMGLAITHGIITGHGGAIDVSSEPGAGTTFDVYLPLAEETKPALDANG